MKVLAILVVAGLMASPVMGSVCTMSCGDSGSCCCQGGDGAGEVSLSAPNCCEGEYRPSDGSVTDGERTFNSLRSGQFFAVAQPGSAAIAASDYPGGVAVPAPHGSFKPPPSQIFLLNASFLI